MEFFKFFTVSHPMDVLTGSMVFIAFAYAVGDYVANKTKAICSMVFVTAIFFLVAFWLGLPKDIFDRVLIGKYSLIVMPFILVQMGTLMKVKDLVSEWKTVTIALLGLIGLSVGLYYLGGPLIGRIMALTAAGPISGGIVSTIIVREAVEAKGLTELVVFASLLLALQGFFGLPVASYCLKIEGRRLLGNYHASGSSEDGSSSAGASSSSDPEVPLFRLFPATPKDLQTTFILMFKVFLVGYLALWFAEATGGYVHKLVMALIFGIIFYETGFLEHNIMTKANVAGYALFFCLVPVWTGLPYATPGMVYDLAYPILVSFGITMVTLAVLSFVLGKILGYSWALSMAISVTCMIGFPGTFIVSNEVAMALGRDPKEKEYVLSRILPKMLIGGFTTVTIGSVILAGYLIKVISAL